MALTQAKVSPPPHPHPHPKNPYALLFLPGIFGPLKKGVRALEVCWPTHPIFFASSVHLNINSYENSEKPSQDQNYGYLFSCPSLQVFQLDFESYLVQKRVIVVVY